MTLYEIEIILKQLVERLKLAQNYQAILDTKMPISKLILAFNALDKKNIPDDQKSLLDSVKKDIAQLRADYLKAIRGFGSKKNEPPMNPMTYPLDTTGGSNNIKEIKSLKEILANTLDSQSLIVLDIDQVLIDPFDRILSPKGEPLRKSLMQNLSKCYGIEKGNDIYSIMVKTRKVHLVEEDTPDLIRDLFKINRKVIALTTFPTGTFGCIENVENWRESQLNELGIDFSSAFKNHPRVTFPHLTPPGHTAMPVFQSGILYTGGGGLSPAKISKGEVLKALLSYLNLKPNLLIMVDDIVSNLEEVEKACREFGISCAGYHYTRAINSSEKIDESLARFQFNFLEQHRIWLSDKEAGEKMRKAAPIKGQNLTSKSKEAIKYVK